MIGRVTGYEVGKNKDGEKDVLLLQVEISEPDDVQTVELFRQAGTDYNPPNDSRLFILQVDPSWKIAVACDDGITPATLPGEHEIYGIDANGNKVSRAKCTNDGNLELNGDDDNGVRYSKLELAFNQLKTDFNNLIAAIYNTHTHTSTAPGSPTGPPTPIGTSSAADITPSKIETVKMPGVT